MPSWAPFLAVTGLLLVSLLVLADRSADAIDEVTGATDEGAEALPVDEDTEKTDTRPAPDRTEMGTAVPRDHPHPDITPPTSDPDAVADQPTEYDETAVGSSRGETSRGVDAARFDDPQGIGRPQTETLSSWLLMANVAVTQGLVVVGLIAAAWYFEIPAGAFGVPTEPVAGVPAVGVGLGFGVALWVANELSTTIADVVGAAYDERVRELLAPDSPQGWVALFGVALPLIAVSEELLFRGAIIGVTHAGYGVSEWALAVLASLAFALGHGAQGRVGVVVTGTLGFVLAAGYIVTGSLLVVVVAHYVINALEFLVHEYLGVD